MALSLYWEGTFYTNSLSRALKTKAEGHLPARRYFNSAFGAGEEVAADSDPSPEPSPPEES